MCFIRKSLSFTSLTNSIPNLQSLDIRIYSMEKVYKFVYFTFYLKQNYTNLMKIDVNRIQC